MKRYFPDYEYDVGPTMSEDKNGDWVLYEDVRAEIDHLNKCCAQRGARMQIMYEYFVTNAKEFSDEWYWLQLDYPDAVNWFDDDGVPVDAGGG